MTRQAVFNQLQIRFQPMLPNAGNRLQLNIGKHRTEPLLRGRVPIPHDHAQSARQFGNRRRQHIVLTPAPSDDKSGLVVSAKNKLASDFGESASAQPRLNAGGIARDRRVFHSERLWMLARSKQHDSCAYHHRTGGASCHARRHWRHCFARAVRNGFPQKLHGAVGRESSVLP